MRIRADDSRRCLAEALSSRRDEIGEAVLARVQAIDGAERDGDPEYAQGLRMAVETAIDYSLEAAINGDDDRSPVPAPILSQSRLAARHRVPLETVLRRYLAGHALLGDFLIEQAGRQRMSPDLLRRALRDQASRTDRIVALISAAYMEETRAARPLTTGRRRADLARRLLAGELIDPTALDYGLDRWHVGVVASGPCVGEAIATVAAHFDASRLQVDPDDAHVWAWLGFGHEPEAERIASALSAGTPTGTRIGMGEPGRGRPGWRLTHDQARAALSVVVRQTERCARYADVALLASAMRDELLTTSLRRLYVAPLEGDRNGGKALLDTLRAYLEYEQSVTSTAAALGVSRNTVTNRLRAIEEKVRPVSSMRAADFKVALQLSDLVPVADSAESMART